ncbi:MAG: 3-deoxy-D-manno-octulosonic-acid transferase [Cellvibrionaceae bacterium]|jgi:3-deoxy-D-manno-octulosonic-acid transferase
MLSALKFRLQYVLYSVFWLVFSLPLLLYIFFHYRHYPKHSRRIFERFGLCQKSKKGSPTTWMHLASVGEVKAALPLITQILNNYPGLNFVFTTSTPSGERVLKKALGEEINHSFLPFDLPWSMGAFLKRKNVSGLLLFETEIWPALIFECKKRAVSIRLINARLSENSEKKYAKFLSFSSILFGNIEHISAQTESDAKRFRSLGALFVSTVGNLKFDQAVTRVMEVQAERYKSELLDRQFRKIILAASVHPDEVKKIIGSYVSIKADFSKILLILAPRHLEKLDQIESICRSFNITVQRKSAKKSVDQTIDLLLVDTMGELLMLCGCADIVIMGGTFIARGGHNFLEPAAWGVPIISGESDYNFKAIAQDLVRIGALVQVDRQDLLSREIKRLLEDDALCTERGESARNYIVGHRGAVGRYLDELKVYLDALH